MSGEAADPVAWLRAQVEADRAAAVAASASGTPSATWTPRMHPSDHVMVRDGNGDPVVYDEGVPSDGQAAHMVLHGPLDVIADCEAKLAILDEHGGEHMCFENTRDGNTWDWYIGDCSVMRCLFGAYKFRSGYDEKWRVPS